MRFYEISADPTSRHTGHVNAAHRWGLPGVHCSECGNTWSEGLGTAYPSVDLSSLAEREDFETPRPEPIEEFERLRELVKPLLPMGAYLPSGCDFGPLVGSATGSFGPFYFQNPWTLLIQREALERVQPKGLQGVKGCKTELRFRQKKAPELLELELEPHGHLHVTCLPQERPPPCPRCGLDAVSLPEEPVLDAASLPSHLDVFRLRDFSTVMIATERFREAVQHLALGDIAFRELPLR